MLSPTSPVFDAYPADFVLALNGKRADWEAIALLPFINQPRLLAAVHAIDQSGKLTEAERARNVLGEDLIVRKLKFLDGAVDQLENTERDSLAAELDARYALFSAELHTLFGVLEKALKLSRVD